MKSSRWPGFFSLLMLPLLAACASEADNFSQYPGFAAWYAQHPRREQAATAAERLLLERFRPQLFVAAGSEGPLSFYKDYIAHGRLRVGTQVLTGVTPAALNAVRGNRAAAFEHIPTPGPVTPVLFARLDEEEVPGLGRCQFLTYHAVFRHSGLPAGLGRLTSLLAAAFGHLDDWHQLDHYTAVTIVLGPGERPLGYLLQQHNYLRSYLAGADFAWPEDDRVRVVAAKRSNELYPWRAESTAWRAGSFLDAGTTDYLVAGTPLPRMAARDVAEAAHEVAYTLDYLPPSDAFYSFAGFLGARRRLPGRDGPPGADYNALPLHKSLALQLALFNWREGDAAQSRLMLEALATSPAELPARMAPLYQRLHARLAEPLPYANSAQPPRDAP